MPQPSAAPIIVFGAFDRHNFGDLLFPHIVSALLPQKKLILAGLAERDLTGYGGHRVQALPALLNTWRGESPVILHAGGELLGCDAWEAAVMLQSQHEAEEIILQRDADHEARSKWAARYLGIDDIVPYMTSPLRLPHGTHTLYNAVGGTELASKPSAMRNEVLAKLAAADFVGVRDEVSLNHLKQANISASLLPDPASLAAELFGDQLSARGKQGEVAAVRSMLGRYLAVQFSAEFGDDATLAIVAEQLRNVMRQTGCGIVLFRAGAAPWHDDMQIYHRITAQLSDQRVRIFSSLHIWDICALIAHSQGYCGSSLHGRIVAMAYGLPRVNLLASWPGRPVKQTAYAESWEGGVMPGAVTVDGLHDALADAMSVPVSERFRIAAHCAAVYRQGFESLCRSAGF